jgi:hypothetical protein
MENEATTKTPIPPMSGFHNFPLCTLIFPFSTKPATQPQRPSDFFHPFIPPCPSCALCSCVLLPFVPLCPRKGPWGLSGQDPRSTSVERPLQIGLFLQNKANFKMGNINISTARTKAYAKEQRTMSTKGYPKQTQTNPISPPSVPNFVDKSWSLCHHIGNCVYWTLEVVLELRFGAEKCRQSRLVLAKENSYEE